MFVRTLGVRRAPVVGTKGVRTDDGGGPVIPMPTAHSPVGSGGISFWRHCSGVKNLFEPLSE